MLKTYYDIFRIPKNATNDEITEAYQSMLERYRARYEDEDFDRKAAILEKAYRVLTDPGMRAKYDRMLKDMEQEALETKKAVKPELKDDMQRRAPVMRTVSRANNYEEEAEPRDKKKLAGIIIAIVVAFLVIAGGGFYFYNYMYLPESHYKDAVKLANKGEYDKAIAELKKLKDYKNSQEQIVKITIAKGNSLVNAKNYDEALEVFNTISNEKEKTAAKTAMAENLLAQKLYDKAIAIYQEMGDEEGVNSCKYAQAADLAAQGKNAEAYAAYKELGSFKDSADKVTEIKTAMEKIITDELATMTEQMFSIMPTAQEYVVKLTALEKEATEYDLETALAQIQEKWTTVENIYYAVYFRDSSSLQSKKNDNDFETMLMTNTKSISGAVDNATTHFAEKPEYVSLYLKCLPGVSEKELNVTWYKYKLDRATGDYTEREQVYKSEAQTMKVIKKNLAVMFGFEKDSFTYGAGLYAAEVTVTDETEPAGIIYFYLQ